MLVITRTIDVCRFDSTRKSLLPLLSTLVTDVEFVVRQHLAEQFSGLCKVSESLLRSVFYWHMPLQFFVEDGGESGYTLLVNSLLPLLSKLVGDPQAEVSRIHLKSQDLTVPAFPTQPTRKLGAARGRGRTGCSGRTPACWRPRTAHFDYCLATFTWWRAGWTKNGRGTKNVLDFFECR